MTFTAHSPEYLTQEIRPVDSFYSSAMPDADSHRYPGERPETSFLTDGTNVMPLAYDTETSQFEVTTAEGIQEVDDWLDARGVAQLEDRIPVVSYGANNQRSEQREAVLRAVHKHWRARKHR